MWGCIMRFNDTSSRIFTIPLYGAKIFFKEGLFGGLKKSFQGKRGKTRRALKFAEQKQEKEETD